MTTMPNAPIDDHYLKFLTMKTITC